jgi:hypothetical protein
MPGESPKTKPDRARKTGDIMNVGTWLAFGITQLSGTSELSA